MCGDDSACAVVFGGWDGRDMRNDLHLLDLGTQQWR
eukprot:CAMPEP_0198325966 /NCGR_PEP_ID=MMETSP1450-20131203/13598_1 /TAXON_ID=753684 ORGANISM="Madagascaria erythrocladiodes, Strain CCMP3234" /NCGR_SAMPLE_ID=MMETSP1450 /ASSEMBLY_ACC=CAM_ASM_001115 /LENGTH=35 /DNA_ID= /DNA_START= /DNA_END= /DNA_ORIENTATION=